jgi:DNA-binding XRE family transcriptional regulator
MSDKFDLAVCAYRTDVAQMISKPVKRLTPETAVSWARSGVAVVVDAACVGGDDDELLALLGTVKAKGAAVALYTSNEDHRTSVLLHEMCNGLVFTDASLADFIAEVLLNRCDKHARFRFDYVTWIQESNSILGVFSDGNAVLLDRPVDITDDGTPIRGIVLADNATTAIITLDNGYQTKIRADVPKEAPRRLLSSRPSPVAVREKPSVRVGASRTEVIRRSYPTKSVARTTDPISSSSPSNVGERFKKLRISAGVTQDDIAKKAGIARPNVSRLESGKHTPSLSTLQKLADALGVPLAQVIEHDAVNVDQTESAGYTRTDRDRQAIAV